MNLAPPPRVVKPRNRTHPHRPVVALSNGKWLDEHGQIGDVADFTRTLYGYEPTLFASVNAADFVATLDEHFSEWEPSWQWRASTNEKNIITPNGLRMASRINTVIHFFGFKNGNYHKIIDPVTMYGRSLDQIWPGDDKRIVRLLQWAVTLRDFCEKNGWDIKPTIGGISAQSLTDRRFYPKVRRKVPASINQRVREQLPGNYYQLNVPARNDKEFKAWYLDQRRAHHFHARNSRLPDANSLYAFGHFLNVDRIAFERTIENFYGLYCVDLCSPPWELWVKGGIKVFVFSNELTHLVDSGYRVLGVRAAWGSRHRDTGIAKYSRWAEKQLDHYGDPAWLKPLLLATYGTLAVRPRYGESIFKMARSGEPVTLVTGNKQMSGLRVTSRKKLEPRIANVLHRGMIEAATRAESVAYATWLADQGYRILSIYADAVIVEQDGTKDLPPLPPPWRLQTTLNHLQFLNRCAFQSGEMTKLPGISRELRQYHPTQRTPAPHKPLYEAITGRPAGFSERRI